MALRIERAGRWPSLFAALIVPLVGSITYLIAARRFSLALVAAYYPFAFVPLAFWAAFLAPLGTRGLRALWARLRCGPGGLAATGLVGGAAVGRCFMLIFVGLARVFQPSEYFEGFLPYIFSGLMAGAAVGIFAAIHLASRRAAPDASQR